MEWVVIAALKPGQSSRQLPAYVNHGPPARRAPTQCHSWLSSGICQSAGTTMVPLLALYYLVLCLYQGLQGLGCQPEGQEDRLTHLAGPSKETQWLLSRLRSNAPGRHVTTCPLWVTSSVSVEA